MKRIVKYTATDPYYSDVVQSYIGTTEEEVYNIQHETEEFMRGEHSSLNMIYKSEIIREDFWCEPVFIPYDLPIKNIETKGNYKQIDYFKE